MAFSTLVLVAVLFLLQSKALASVIKHNARQTSSLPTGWSFTACYSDNVDSRTLRTASFTSVDNMTISSCINFCTSGNFQFSGLEFGRECYCDNTIRSPGVIEPTTDCNMACTGDSTTTCGAANRLSVFSGPVVSTTTTSAPPTTTQPTGPVPTRPFFAGSLYEYQGCIIDPLTPRGLQHQVSVLGGNTPDGCAKACKANGFRVMGLEFGGECWCDDFLPYGNLQSDGSCNMPCAGDPTSACGGPALLQVYGDINNLSGNPLPSQCMGDGRDSATYTYQFRLRGITNQGDILNVGAVELSPGAGTYILTFGGGDPCPDCKTFSAFALQNNQLVPKNADGNPVTIRAAVGESQFFVTGSEPAFDGYCAGFLGTNNLPFYGFPVLDQTDGTSNGWGLCLNNTANGRRDAVYAPVQNHPHYDFFNCILVSLQFVS